MLNDYIFKHINCAIWFSEAKTTENNEINVVQFCKGCSIEWNVSIEKKFDSKKHIKTDLELLLNRCNF